MSRAKSLAVKALLAVGAVLMVASAFVVSLVVLAIGMAVVLVAGGYLWWQTRELRAQFRARKQALSQPPGRIIEGEAIPRDRPAR